jgi:5S rRNA maturation endonuclease (ribonuclease M5)
MDNYTQFDLFDFLVQIGTRYKQRGKEVMLERCPFCEQGRAKASDHFSFRADTGQYNCIKCNSKGNLITFKRDLGYEPFEYKIYHKSNQEKAKTISEQPETYYTAYKNARGIPEEILKKYGVGKFEDEKLGSCRTYQYVDIETGEISNIKYINKNKQMKTESNAKKIYYGLQFVDFTKPFLHITEGEDDCHALAACEFENVVSVPYGANNYSEEMGQINKKFRELYLFFDNDKAGQEGAKKFSERAGVWKCRNIVLPFKDCRDCYLNGFDKTAFENIKDKAKEFEYSPETRERPALSLTERIRRFETDAIKNHDGILFGYDIIDKITGGLRGGDVMTVVANPGCYKTTFLMNFLKRAIDKQNNGIAIFFSLEMQIEAEFERELQINLKYSSIWDLRKKIKSNPDDWQSTKEALYETDYNRLWVSEENGLTIDGIEKVIKATEEVAGKNCIIVGIDYIDFIDTKETKEYDSVKKIMLGVKKQIAKKLNVPVIILCQTNRENKQADDEVGARSGKGGSAIEATSDFSIGLWLNDGRVIGRMTKHRRIVCFDRQFPYFDLKFNKTLCIDDIIECEKPKKKKDDDI